MSVPPIAQSDPSQLDDLVRYTTARFASTSISRADGPGPVQGSSSPSSRSGELGDDIRDWEGRTVFCTPPEVYGPSPPSSHILSRPDQLPAAPISTPAKVTAGPASAIGTGSGTADSPISIASSSTSPVYQSDNVHRIRARPVYTSPAARTAYTPPRSQPTAPFVRTNSEPSPSSSSTKQTQASQAGRKPIHPFFHTRTQTLPVPTSSQARRSAPPPSHKPRFVAHYSSTSASESQTSQDQSQSSQSQPTRSQAHTEIRARLAELDPAPQPRATMLEDDGGIRDEEIATLMADLELQAEHAPTESVIFPLSSNTKPTPKSRTTSNVPNVGKNKTVTPNPYAHLPTFSHTTLPHPPKLAYTSSSAEADDLVACLRGPVIGMDLEWPVAGSRTERRADGSYATIRRGMTWDVQKGGWAYKQLPVAMIQLCDDRMVILLHLMEQRVLPPAVAKLLQNDKILKVGVAIQGDGRKLLRDFPSCLPEGVKGLVELNRVARHVDPVGMGPSKVMVGLRALTANYLQKDLEKDVGVRHGDWDLKLDEAQVQYAANDVVAGLQLWSHFDSLSSQGARAAPLNPAEHGVNLDPPPPMTAPATAASKTPASAGASRSQVDNPKLSTAELATKPEASAPPSATQKRGRGRPKLPRTSTSTAPDLALTDTIPPTRHIIPLAEMPSGQSTLELFRVGWTMEQIAQKRNIKPDTACAHALRSAAKLKPEQRIELMGRETIKLLLAAIRRDGETARVYAAIIEQLRTEVSTQTQTQRRPLAELSDESEVEEAIETSTRAG